MNEIYENIFLHIIWKLKFNAKTINKKIVLDSLYNEENLHCVAIEDSFWNLYSK